MEDIFENELYWLFLVGNRPNEVTVADIENSQEIIKELLQKNCHLIIQIPMLLVYKLLLASNVIAENTFFKLLFIPSTAYNEHIWNPMYENEYNSWTFFLIKSIKNVEFKLPTSSAEQMSIEQIGQNELFYLRLEIKELIICTWE